MLKKIPMQQGKETAPDHCYAVQATDKYFPVMY